MERLTDLPTTPDGLLIGKNGLPKLFLDEKGMPSSGREVVETMRLGRILEAIDRKPACVAPADKATVLPGVRLEIYFNLQPRRHDPMAGFDLQPTRSDSLADFDLQIKRRKKKHRRKKRK